MLLRFFTLGAPIIVLMVPIMDTLIAILRRKIHHKKFSEADRGHLHHNLMFKLKLGQRKSVLVLYLVTFLFSLSSYLYYYNPTAGTILFIALMIMFEIFVEVTDMISRKYKPILTIVNIFIDSDKLPKIKFLDRYRKRRSPQKAVRDHLIIALCFLLMIVGVGYFMTSKDTPLPIKTETVQSPYTKSGDSELLNNIYARLDTSYKNKDEEEIALVQKACDITDQIFMEAISTIHIGMKEYELSAFLQYLALKNGASGMAFDTIVASGQRGAMPHGRPTDKPFAEHEFITIDFGIVYQGYQSDMTRTVCIGTPDPEVKKIYDIVFEAQCAGVEFIKAGIRGKDVDDYVRSIISNHGYGEYFTHGLGHGMGMGDGELPVLNQRSETILEEGMIMSCEPGIYVPGIGGVRIEDDVLIRNGVGVALNHTPKTLIQLEVK